MCLIHPEKVRKMCYGINLPLYLAGKSLRLLIRRLIQASVTKNTKYIISGMMRKPGDEEKRIAWMDENPDATQREILDHAVMIRDEGMEKLIGR